MDETTLNDLLECSVCLERLDTTSKVLPCQHTFCRGCLEVIVVSHHELRCPECRVLVDIKIDDLPPNVLLMRILEGLKNSTSAASTSMPKTTNEQTANTEVAQKKSSAQQPTHVPQQQQMQPQRRCLLPHAYALYDFDSSEPTDLHFKKGELILLKHKIDANWYVGQLNGMEGTFPSNYVQVIVPLPTPQAVALYDFKMQPSEEEGCLNFKKGALVHVLRRVDQNWAEGRIGNAIGIFPIAFVELNALAKKLLQRIEPKTTLMPPLQQHKPQQQLQINAASLRNLPPIPLLDPTTNNASDTTTTSPSTESPSSQSNATTSPSASENHNAANVVNTSSSSNLSTNSNSLPNTPQHYAHETVSGGGSVRYRNGREKRHSLNALSFSNGGNAGSATPSLSILQTNRHSAEILSIPSEELIVGSNEHQAAVAAAMPQTTVARQQRQSSQNSTGGARANVLKTACGPMNVPLPLPWGYLALYPYKPSKSDELELKKGCVYIVTERCLDGWFKGKNWQDISGVFPGNYVTPLRARDQQQLMHQFKYVPQQSTSPPLQAAPSPNAASTSTNKSTHPNSVQNCSKTFPKPPELPPRHAATTTTCASVWTKPLSHTVEAFFNRGSSTGKNEEKSKEKETKTKDASSSSSSSGAVSLMKRLTHIKSRAKSPGTTARNAASTPIAGTVAENSTTASVNMSTVESALQATANLQPVHTRSGSCPSQLLQSMPQSTANVTNQQTHKQQQQQLTNLINHGSERIKGHKERPRIQNTRQSVEGNMRGSIYANVNAPTTAAMITNNFQLNPKCSQQFQMQQQQHFPAAFNVNHRKSNSLDANNMLGGLVTANAPTISTVTQQPPPPSMQPTAHCNAIAAAVAQSATTKSTHCGRESRFRCIVPYPPNSDVELELHVGDIIYVQRKQKNGWYKGTHARTQKTGLFPASFVEPDF